MERDAALSGILCKYISDIAVMYFEVSCTRKRMLQISQPASQHEPSLVSFLLHTSANLCKISLPKLLFPRKSQAYQVISCGALSYDERAGTIAVQSIVRRVQVLLL